MNIFIDEIIDLFNKHKKTLVSKYYKYKNRSNEYVIAGNEELLQPMRKLIREILPFEKRCHSEETSNMPSTAELNRLIWAAVNTELEKSCVDFSKHAHTIIAKINLISSCFHHVFWEAHFEEFKRTHNESESRLLTAIVAAQENERKRLAVTLHDDVVQSLAGILFRIQSLRNYVYKGDNDNLLQEIVEVEELFRKNIQKCRLVSFDMDSFWLEKAGFIPTLKSHIRDFENNSGIKVLLKSQEAADNIPRLAQTHLFRVIQEALNNAKNHSEATEITIHLLLAKEEVELTILDNGQGFVLNNSFWDELGVNHFGLLSIEQRSKLLGGTFRIETAPGCGTNLYVKIPINQDKADHIKINKGEMRISPWIKSV